MATSSRRSWVYGPGFFIPPSPGGVPASAECCSCKKRLSASSINGTSHLQKHLVEFCTKITPEQRALAERLQGLCKKKKPAREDSRINDAGHDHQENSHIQQQHLGHWQENPPLAAGDNDGVVVPQLQTPPPTHQLNGPPESSLQLPDGVPRPREVAAASAELEEDHRNVLLENNHLPPCFDQGDDDELELLLAILNPEDPPEPFFWTMG